MPGARKEARSRFHYAELLADQTAQATGFTDVQITHAALEGNVHRELTVRTGGFRLSIDRAVVELGEDVVDIRPVRP